MALDTRDTEIQSTTETGQPPKNRINNVKAAWNIFHRLLENNKETAKGRAKIQGLIDGNRPYSEASLRGKGQAWRSNVNWREAEGIIDSNTSAYLELILEVQSLIQVELELEKDEKPPLEPSMDWRSIIEEEFTKILRDWDGFYYNFQLLSREIFSYGASVVYFVDEFNWMYEVAKSAAVLVPAGTRSSLDRSKYFLIRDTMEVDEIWDIVENGDKAEKAGWNLTGLKQTMIDVYFNKQTGSRSTTHDKYQLSDWESIQQRVKNGDIIIQDESDFEPLKVAHELVTEADGKVSHYIFQEEQEPEWFLFEGDRRFDSMSHAVVMFTFNVGDGYYKSVKGLGHRIYPHLEMSNRLMNATLDGGMINAGLILEPVSGSDKGDTKLMRLGPVTIPPEGYKLVQASFSPQIQHLVQLRAVLQNLLNNNTGVFRQNPEIPNAPEQTLGEVQIKETKEARFEKNQAFWYYLQWDMLMREVFRRLVNPDYPSYVEGHDQAQKFVKRCVDRGVPKSILKPEKVRVKASRAIGLGSPVVKSLVTTEVFNARGAFDERGRTNATRDWLAPRVGYADVDRYMPIQNRNTIPTSENSLIALENNDFSEGKPVPVGVDQPHVLHASGHLTPIVELVTLFNRQPQSIDVMAATVMLETALPHVETHVQLMSQDPAKRNDAKQFADIIGQIQVSFTQMQRMSNEMLRAQQQQRAREIQVLQKAQQDAKNNETLIALQKLENEKQTEMARQESIAETRRLKTENQIQLRNTQAASDMRRKDIETASDIRRKDTEAAADVRRKTQIEGE